MRKIRVILILGVWVAVLPYLGFPSLWKNIFFFISGAGMIYIGYILYQEYKLAEGGKATFDNFIEN